MISGKIRCYPIAEIFQEELNLFYELLLFSLPVDGKMNDYLFPCRWVPRSDGPRECVWTIHHGEPDPTHDGIPSDGEFSPHAAGEADFGIILKWKYAFAELFQFPQRQLFLDGFFGGADIYNLEKFHGLLLISPEQGIYILPG